MATFALGLLSFCLLTEHNVTWLVLLHSSFQPNLRCCGRYPTPIRQKIVYFYSPVSATSLDLTPMSSHDLSSPRLKGLKKVLSSRKRSLDAGQRDSIASLSLDPSPQRKSAQSSPSRDDGSSKSGSSGVRKLLPGHSKRKRRKRRQDELKAAEEEAGRGRSLSPSPAPEPPFDINRSVSSLTQDADSLLTDDSEPDL